MLVYNVTVKVDHQIAEEWLDWMRTIHIPNVLATGAFNKCRLSKLDMKEDDEEGIGVSLTIEHFSPAFENEEVEITSFFEEINEKKEIVTLFELKVGERLIAKGVQKQRILLKTKIQKIFENIKDS